jgi:uncharacterized protein YuzE
LKREKGEKMIKNMSFDYDQENDILFLYDETTKSKASIDIDDIIIDYDSRKEISAIELLNTSKFFKDLDVQITKESLNELSNCAIEIIPKGRFFILRLNLKFKSGQLTTPIYIPSIHETSPAVAIH